jgi:hypothetical protein
LLAGSPPALPVSVTDVPAGTSVVATEIETVMLGGGGGGVLLPLQPTATIAKSKPASNAEEIDLVFTGSS